MLDLDFAAVSDTRRRRRPAARSRRAYRLLIGGEWVDGRQRHLRHRQPGHRAGRRPRARTRRSADAEAAAAAAAEAFPAWSRTTPERAGRAAEPGPPTCSTSATRSSCRWCRPRPAPPCGSPRRCRCRRPAARFRRYAQGIARGARDPDRRRASCRPPRSAPGGIIGGVARRAPVGVVACITSYNFPMTNMAGKLGPALAMGNTVVVKPAPQDPLGHRAPGRGVRRGRLPAGRGQRRRGRGPGAGRGAGRVAARRHGQLHRLDRRRPAHRRGRRPRHEAPAAGARRQGRRASCSTTPTSRPPSPASPRVWAFHSGQICTAPTRVLAQRGIYDQLVERAQGRRRAPEGRRPARAPTPCVGPVITEVHRDRVEGYVASGRDEGGTVVAGGERPDLDARLLRGAHADRRLQARHEGRAGGDLRPGRRRSCPSTTRTRPSPSPTAPSSASTTTCSRPTRPRPTPWPQQLRTGNVGINTAQRNHELPFGGFKMSGVGRDGGTLRLPRLQRAAVDRLAGLTAHRRREGEQAP